jgi:hypothetical protein
MIKLGIIDSDVQPAALNSYIQKVKDQTVQIMGKDKLRGEANDEWVEFERLPAGGMKVAHAQSFLKQAGFFPFGEIDGVCGYRTQSAIRLFQEYVRSVEGETSIGFPDGKLGPNSAKHVRRWQENGKQADWSEFSSANQSREYKLWLDLLNRFKHTYSANPNAALKLVNAYSKPTGTVKPAQWDFDPKKIHLIAIRRKEAVASGAQKFDDFFILLINGLVFKFRGSTDPGATRNKKGLPFLVMGQHLYRYGWHLQTNQERGYHALKPLGGVLIVRSKDKALTDADLANDLENNHDINVHWGGEGFGNVGNWSEGCQVIIGKAYVNHQDRLIDCSQFAAPKYSALGKKVGGVYQTKGAYTLLADIVTALSGADPTDNLVRYTLIYERDLMLSPELGVNGVGKLMAQFQA